MWPTRNMYQHMAASVTVSHLRGLSYSRVARVLPEIPVDRQQPEPDRGKMLLQLEHALRLPEPLLLDRDAHVDAVLGVDPAAEDEGDDPQHADRGGIARALHRAKARDEAAGGCRLPHRHQHRHRLMRERAEQRHREQRVNGEQDGPERVDRDVVEDEIHRLAPVSRGVSGSGAIRSSAFGWATIIHTRSRGRRAPPPCRSSIAGRAFTSPADRAAPGCARPADARPCRAR